MLNRWKKDYGDRFSVGRLQNDRIIDRMWQRYYFLHLEKKKAKISPMLSSKRSTEIKGERISVSILPLQRYMQQAVLSGSLCYILCFITCVYVLEAEESFVALSYSKQKYIYGFTVIFLH